jgi:hypothetical protein
MCLCELALNKVLSNVEVQSLTGIAFFMGEAFFMGDPVTMTL